MKQSTKPSTHPPTTTQQQSRTLRTLAPIYCYFLVAGLATVMLGPLLPALIAHWHIQDAQAGTLFSAYFAGQFAGAWFATRNLRTSVLYGAALSAVSCLSLCWLNFEAAHIALFCMGLGLGAGLTAGNVIVGTTVSASRTRFLAMLNIAWGLGAIACPLLILLCAGAPSRFFATTAVCFALSALISIALPRATSEEPSSAPAPRILPLPPVPLFLFASTIFLYVGVENALGGWLPAYAARSIFAPPAASIALWFWIAELAGRLLISALLSFVEEIVLYRASLIALIVVEILLITIIEPSTASIRSLVILSGLTMAPLFPLIVSFTLARTGRHSNLGPLFATASLGGATLPWLTGVLSTHRHSLRIGLLVPVIAAISLLGLSLFTTKRIKEHSQDLQPHNP